MIAIGNVLQLAVVLVLLLLSAPSLIALLTGVGCLVIAASTVRSTDLRLGLLDVVSARLPATLAAHRPRFAVYFSSTVGADYQVGMWAQYFDRIGMPYVYVVRSLAMMRTIGEITTAPVVYRSTLAQR